MAKTVTTIQSASLRNFSRQDLYNIIDSLGKKLKIYESEAQFQHELAWEIHKRYKCEVHLEALTCITNQDKKEYTDILLEEGDYKIAIELKYKTAAYGKPDDTPYLKLHGAQDLGRYDYLKDIERLETLATHNRSDYQRLISCNKAFAVFLTNAPHYWNPHTGTPAYSDFSFEDQTPYLITAGSHTWGPTCKSVQGTARGNAINLSKSYDYQWRDYATISGKNGCFRYVATEY